MTCRQSGAERGKDILDKVCDDAPAKIVDTLGKLDVAERLAPEEKIDFNEAKNMREIGVKLLQSIGFREPDEDSIQLAIQANNDFIMTLKRIHQCAQASPEDEIH